MYDSQGMLTLSVENLSQTVVGMVRRARIVYRAGQAPLVQYLVSFHTRGPNSNCGPSTLLDVVDNGDDSFNAT